MGVWTPRRADVQGNKEAVMAEKKNTMHYSINDLKMNWDDSTRRKVKPCVVCGKLTTGRMKGNGGLVQAAHVSCAFGSLTDKALQVYGRVDA